MLAWSWACAASRGTSHIRTDTRLQDAFSCSRISHGSADRFYGVISDGAGSASFGGQGASIVCRTLSGCIRRFVQANQVLPDDDEIESWIDLARDRIFLAAQRRNLSPRDFAATVVAVLTSGAESVVLHIGDGCAVFQDESSGEWIAPTWPEQGEFASTTYFITDENEVRLRISRYSNAISAVALFTDGLERLALDFQTKRPFAGFFTGIFKPLLEKSGPGKQTELSRSLKAFLDSEPVTRRTDDDKSIIIAVRK